jgi:SAM-dependent methyltransferase
VTTFRYQRTATWIRSAGNGWTTPAVAARFDAGCRGEFYLEYLEFDGAMRDQPAGKELLALLTRTGTGGTLIDHGCGNGVLRQLLGEAQLTKQWVYIGLDINPMSIESCRNRFPDTRFETITEGEPLPFDDDSVDTIFSGGVLEFVERPEALLAEFGRISRGWVGLCRLGVRSTAPAIYWQTVEHRWGREEHCIHVFNDRELTSMIERAGFRVVSRELSDASGEWLPPDAEPLQYFSWLLQRSEHDRGA